jgi:hypothetical protein
LLEIKRKVGKENVFTSSAVEQCKILATTDYNLVHQNFEKNESPRRLVSLNNKTYEIMIDTQIRILLCIYKTSNKFFLTTRTVQFSLKQTDMELFNSLARIR